MTYEKQIDSAGFGRCDHSFPCMWNPKLPDEFSETILDGGCHAYFGMYGAQEGDGTPEISNEEQIALTVDAISEMVLDVQ